MSRHNFQKFFFCQTMIFVFSSVSYMTYVPLQISCRFPLRDKKTYKKLNIFLKTLQTSQNAAVTCDNPLYTFLLFFLHPLFYHKINDQHLSFNLGTYSQTDTSINYYREDMFEILYPRIRNGEIRMAKYLYVIIIIMNNVLWRGREGFLPSVGC